MFPIDNLMKKLQAMTTFGKEIDHKMKDIRSLLLGRADGETEILVWKIDCNQITI